MKNILSVLLNEPFMVEESWLKQAVELFGSVKIEDPKAFFFDEDDARNEPRYSVIGRTAHVPMTGPIFPRPNMLTKFFGVGVALSDFAQDLKAIIANSEIDSVVLNIDSPGGSVTGVNETANMIKAATSMKPITAYVSGTGASAAYWLASAASEVVLDPTSRVGSIGVVVAHSKSDDGSIEIVNSASPNKRPDPTTEQGRGIIVSQLDELANVFIEAVAVNRKVPTMTVMNDFGKGGIVVGQRAVSLGMADRLGSLDELIQNTNINTGDNYMTLTLEELKEKHSDVFQAAVNSVSEELTGKISAKEGEISTLKAQLMAATQTNISMEERIKAIEKSEAIRQERENKTLAESIMTTTLSDSTVPKRLHPKVATQVNYESFVKDGKLDMVSYTTAVKTEVADWEKEFANSSPVSGVPTAPRTVAGDPDDTADTDAVTRMLGFIGIKQEGK